MDLERLLQLQGYGSRRECRGMIAAGRVEVNGAVCDDPGETVQPEGLAIAVDGVAWVCREKVYVALHKPAGYECSHKPQHHPSVFSLLPRAFLARGVQAVGRLDEDTTGLLLLSDDGQFIHTYSSPKKKVPKVYEASVKHPLDSRQLDALLAGVVLHDEPLPIAAAACAAASEHLLRLTVTEGKYHLVKRMVAAAGNRVEALHRTAVGGFFLPDDLPPGAWRCLEAADLARLAMTRAP